MVWECWPAAQIAQARAGARKVEERRILCIKQDGSNNYRPLYAMLPVEGRASGEEMEEGSTAVSAEYRQLAVAWGESAANPSRANELFDQLQSEYLALRATDEGREGIEALMSDEVPAVRLSAAAHSLAWAPESARTVLEDLDRDGPPGIAISAKYTLREFDRGRLDLDWAPE